LARHRAMARGRRRRRVSGRLDRPSADSPLKICFSGFDRMTCATRDGRAK
jgi:hypothetical protein